jgi:two-component sensor histidine kinase
MTLRVFLLYLLVLLSLPTIVAQPSSNAAHGKVSFHQAEELAQQNPNEAYSKLKSNDFRHFGEIQQAYLKAFIFERLGQFDRVDSVMQIAFDGMDFSQDSILYMKFLMVLSEQKKISSLDYQGSLECIEIAAFLARKYKDTLALITSKISIGELFRATQNYKQGHENLEEAERLLSQFSKKDNWRLTARLYDRRAAIFLQAKVFPDSVKKLTLKVIELAELHQDQDLLANACNSLGYLYLETDSSNSKTEFYFLKAIANWDEIGYAIYATNARINLVRYYQMNGQYDKGIELLVPQLALVDSSDWGWEKGGFYGALGRLYEQKGEYKKAMHFIQQSNAILTEIETAKFHDKLTEYSISYKVKEKEEELLRKQLEIELNETALAAAKNEKTYLYLLLFAAILIVAISIYFVRNQKRQKTVIVKANLRLNDLVNQRENLLKEMNHRVKNNLTVLSSLLFLQNESVENEEAKNALNDSQLRIHSISLIHESLYQQEDMEKVNFQDYLESMLEHMKEIYWQGKGAVDSEINMNDFEPDLKDSVPLGMIFNELFTNSFKYAFANVKAPKISIQYANNALIYSDNGPGFDPEVNSTGLGYELIATFIVQLNATLIIEKQGEFTQITIQL